MALSKSQLLEKAQHVVNLLYHEYIPANLFIFIGVNFFILRVPRFVVGV